MENVLVIADDLSGAAEIAGIGHRYGLTTRLLREPPDRFEPGLTIIDTDSRSLAPDEAADAVTRFVAGVRPSDFELIYKKTDSVLRGPIAAELDALVKGFGRLDALLVPQNPSRGRIIVNGEYLIDNVPLHETPFASDPVHPARSSRVSELVRNVRIGDGASIEDLRAWATRIDNATLPAGGADFFTAILQHAGLGATLPPLDRLSLGRTLFVSGTAGAAGRIEGVPTFAMVESTEQWCDDVCRALDRGSRALMTIDRPLDADASTRFEMALAKAAACVVRRGRVSNLLVTGGATASALCRELCWDAFDVDGEFAVGVVQLRPRDADTTSFIVKPGSYPWPQTVQH